MNIMISSDGNVTLVYDEALRLDSLGELRIRRASHVEPADLVKARLISTIVSSSW